VYTNGIIVNYTVSKKTNLHIFLRHSVFRLLFSVYWGTVRPSSYETFFIHAVRHCLQEVQFVWCIKRDQFETENIVEADMKWPPKEQSAASLMLYLSTQSFSIVVCLVVVCT